MGYFILALSGIGFFGLLSGLAHFFRDTRAYQQYGKIQGYIGGKAPKWIYRWWLGGNVNYDPSKGGDWQHFWDSVIRWCGNFRAILVVLETVMIFFIEEWSINIWWYLGLNVSDILISSYAGEWLFQLLYHSFNTWSGHSDYVPWYKMLQYIVTFKNWREK